MYYRASNSYCVLYLVDANDLASFTALVRTIIETASNLHIIAQVLINTAQYVGEIVCYDPAQNMDCYIIGGKFTNDILIT